MRTAGLPVLLVPVLALAWAAPARGEEPATPASVFAKPNLVAWCIVPFDTVQRGPRERAEMLQRLGIRKFAYDWRDQHVATFDEEIAQVQQHGIEYFAFWSFQIGRAHV